MYLTGALEAACRSLKLGERRAVMRYSTPESRSEPFWHFVADVVWRAVALSLPVSMRDMNTLITTLSYSTVERYGRWSRLVRDVEQGEHCPENDGGISLTVWTMFS